jgi:DNA (cytosine-5)-methyltransferase 1
MGYHRAGFDVVGVDINPQPNYPFRFTKADAIATLAGSNFVGQFDAIHASPPCQEHSRLRSIAPDQDTGWMLHATLDLLRSSGLPWVCENVVGAPLPNAPTLTGQHGVELCGKTFGLNVVRHRLFECSFPVEQPPHLPHDGENYSPAGHGDPNWRQRQRQRQRHRSGPGYADRCREAMGIDWMNRDELAQAIPPAYTEFIGKQLIQHLAVTHA